MSWLAKSLVNSLKGEEEEDDEKDEENPTKSPINEELEEEGQTRGVKEDLSELTKTLTRQFWGVASFLAPLPYDQTHPSDTTVEDESETLNSPRLAGIRSDFAEIGGRFKSGISMLSSTKAVSEISKIASNFLPFGSEMVEDEKHEGGGVGVTEEIAAFARNVSMHSETWLDFPSIPDEFDMSDAQQEHAFAVERLAPSLASLRIELCPSHMSEGRFWKIYFVLLHSRLNRQDADLLTTPQIVQARALLLQDLPNRQKLTSKVSDRGATALSKELVVSSSDASDKTSSTNTLTYDDEPFTSILITDGETEKNIISSMETSVNTSSTNTHTYDDEPSTLIPITDVETEKHPVQTTEVNIIDKSVIEEDPPVVQAERNTISIQEFEEDVDDWLEEDDEDEKTAEAIGSKGIMPLGNEEDVSFSDLEEEDDDDHGTSKTPKP